ncbi:MAG: hypothetical protein LC744_02705 [Chloroflexi bacterium]|nr:hypothetical protein [Chloroflexota bacterium]
MIYPNEGSYEGADSHSLLWMVFWFVAPFVALILVVAAVRAVVPAADTGLGGRLTGAAIQGDGERVPVADAAQFDWDRVCVFVPFTPAESVNARLEIDWRGLLDESGPTLVFIAGGSVVRHAAIAARAIDEPASGGECFARDDAYLRWRPDS